MMLAAAAIPAAAQQAPTPACDRACLEGFVDKYLDAMDSDRVDPALFARDLKFTENGAQLPLGGDGLWLRMSRSSAPCTSARRTMISSTRWRCACASSMAASLKWNSW
jgi:hypothetical protein